MLNKIKSVKDSVTSLLTRIPSLRDSDSKLQATIWMSEANLENNPGMSAREFLMAYGREQFTNPEAIRRARQKVQEEQPALRGTNYKGRKEEELVVQQGIKDI